MNRRLGLLALLLLPGFVACGAVPIKPITSFKPEQLPSIRQSGGTASTFDTGDGIKLRYARFGAMQMEPVGTVVLVTGRTQFIEVYLETIHSFRKRGFEVWAMDWRGQGLSGGRLADPHKGHIDSFDRYIADLHHFRTRVVKPVGAHKILVSQSMGGGISLRYLVQHHGQFDKAILGAPLVDLAAPGWLVSFVAWQGESSPHDYVPGEGGGYGQHLRDFQGNPYTLDKRRFLRTHAYIDRDKRLALGAPTKGWIRAARDHCDKLGKHAFASKLRTPVLIFAASVDKLVDNEAQKKFADSATTVRRIVLPETLHEIWLGRDRDQKRIWREVDAFLGAQIRRGL